ncbi:hypothetical protein GA0115246_100231, partial [Streptomyces sp. SolWspMP-sol7th]|uniref:hypothetical protein n=1 Tax=Streptomyces sp. SolWspMP-sol7th TaxID=1839776 RepID=UPI00081D9CD9
MRGGQGGVGGWPAGVAPLSVVSRRCVAEPSEAVRERRAGAGPGSVRCVAEPSEAVRERRAGAAPGSSRCD